MIPLRDSLQRLALAGHDRQNAREGEGDYLGIVTAVDAVKHVCDVKVAGDSAATQSVTYEPDLLLSVNDYVIIHRLGPMRFRVTSRAHPSGTTPSVTSKSVTLSADVTITNPNQYYTGPQMTLGPGTWLVVGLATVSWGNANLGQITAKLMNAGVAVAGAEIYAGANGGYYPLPVNAVMTLTAASTIVRIDVAQAWGGGAIRAGFDVNGAGLIASYLNAIRIPA